MRRDLLYLSDISEAADAIRRFIGGIPQDAFMADELRQSAVLQKLIVIGEAAARLGPDLRNRHAEVPWPDVIGFRNMAVHAYFSVDWSVVWFTATRDVPALQVAVQRMQDLEAVSDSTISDTRSAIRAQGGPMKSYKYVILGGGVAAGYAAKEFAKRGIAKGELAILSADTTAPYQRPHISKEFIRGEEALDDILINPANFYEESGIDLWLNTTVTRADLAQKRLHTAQGDEIGYEQLMIANGCRARTLRVPGAELGNVLYLRWMPDVEAIQKAAKGAKQAVVVGGSFIGMEMAANLTQMGVPTTLVFPEGRVWQRFFTPEMSDFFQRFYRAKGVTILPGAGVTAFKGQGTVSAVVLSDGRELPADLVVAGIGVVPATELWEGTGLALQDGVVVNEYLETNLPGVYAVGDIARFPETTFGRERRIEHWDTARRQGRAAAANMLGDHEPYKAVPYFYSDVFHMGWEFWGDTEGADQVVHRGDLEKGPFTAWWLKGGKLVAAFTIDPPQEGMDKLVGKWIRKGQALLADKLADLSVKLASLE